MTGRVLVAGVGNVFHGDDGFGVAVAARLAGRGQPPGVEVADFGIRGVHLAYQLLDGYDALVLVDAVSRGAEPGTLMLIEPDLPVAGGPASGGAMDAHGMSPDAVLSLLATLGGQLGAVRVVGCEPASVEPGMGLSEPVRQAVEGAVVMVEEVVRTLVQTLPANSDDLRGQQEVEATACS